MQKYLWHVYIANFLFFLVMNAQASIMSPYATSVLGAPPFIVGVLASLLFIVAILFRPFFGFMYDRGYKFEALILGCLTSLLASTAYYIPDIRVLALGRIIHGLGVGVFLPASVSIVLDMAPEGQVGETLGWRSAMYGISQVVGPSVGTYLADFFGFQTTFAVTAFICIVPLIMLYAVKRKVTLPKTAPKKSASKSRLTDIKNADFIIATFATAIYTVGFSGISTFLPAFYKSLGFGTTAYGIYAATAGASSIAVRIFGGKQADRRGPRGVALLGCVIFLASYTSLYFYPLPPSAYLIAFITGIGLGFWVPGIQLLGFKDINPEARGLSSSIYFTCADLGLLLGPIIFGYLIDGYGYPIMFPLLPPIFIVNMAIISASRFFKRKE
ncbi:MAG: MFS transporter [Nitrososphaerota archaeon]|nr:MFS transporter [Candidatus Bathyarchaeota archaeon]MDW8023975.1 MFS transporter [Nitrososphaerota archaeon]